MDMSEVTNSPPRKWKEQNKQKQSKPKPAHDLQKSIAVRNQYIVNCYM